MKKCAQMKMRNAILQMEYVNAELEIPVRRKIGLLLVVAHIKMLL